ncbi:MAG: radical SAM protein [Candidatus Gracilibacteria bacterium]|nr:radical SAM protein [Candidatus Gracilibacteria bacterium]MDD2908609.1 radical SAM protein [Candidatus Gracilibacteria bacterium]
MNFNEVAFVGTYECNANCTYCYARKYKNVYKGIELSFERFKEIALKLKANGTKNISFIGGESTLWKYINEAIKFAKEIGLITNIDTNAIKRLTEIPDKVSIHTNVLFFTKNADIIRNIDFYRRNSRVTLTYNVHDIGKYDLELVKRVLSKFKLTTLLEFIYDQKPSKDIGNYYYELARYLKEEKGIRVISAGPHPICMFSQEQFIYLKYNTFLSGMCDTPLPQGETETIINPDGETILPCGALPFTTSISYLLDNNIPEYIKKFAPYIKNLRQTIPNICKDCNYYGKTCQYGCMVNKMSPEDRDNGKILI